MVNTRSGLALLGSLLASAEEAHGHVTLPLKSKHVDLSAVRNVIGRAVNSDPVGFNVPATDFIWHNIDLQVYFTDLNSLRPIASDVRHSTNMKSVVCSHF